MSFKRSVYNLIPFKKQLFGAFRSLFGPPGMFESLRFNGKFKIPVKEYDTSFYLHNASDLHRETDLFWRGIFTAYESVSLKSWAAISKEGTVVLDVGANTGIFSMLAKAINPKAKVVAFEPIPYNIQLLKKNIAANDFDIEVVEKAISNEVGSCTMYVKPDTVNYMTSVNTNREENSETVELEVPIISIDQFVKDAHFEKVDMIKLDVEGHEPEALQGALEVIRRDLPTMLVEVLSDEDGLKIMEILKPFPYQFYQIEENYVDPKDSTAKRVETLKYNKGQNFLICTDETANWLTKKGIALS